MLVSPNPQIVSDYCTNFGTVRVNRDYQRSGDIWPPRAKSALIETIVLGYPMPAFYLHQCYDKVNRKPFKELVDGQQRSEAIMEFWEGKLRLSKSLPTQSLAGKVITELDAEQYEAFQSYILPIFLFTGADDSDVREAFRRINSFTATLNAAEIRHSSYQGECKWFVNTMASKLSETLLQLGTFKAKDITRMRDAVLIAELCIMVKSGLVTTKPQHIGDFYENNDQAFPDGQWLEPAILAAFDAVHQWRDVITGTAIAKHYNICLLVLAVMHAKASIPALELTVKGGDGLATSEQCRSALSRLAEAVDEYGDAQRGTPRRPAKYKELYDLAKGGESKTNTASQRKLRFKMLFSAVAK